MKKTLIALMMLTILVSLSTTAFAGSFAIKGFDLTPLQQKVVKMHLKKLGIDPAQADVEIIVGPNKNLSNTMGFPILKIETTIIVGGKAYNDVSSFSKTHVGVIIFQRCLDSALKGN